MVIKSTVIIKVSTGHLAVEHLLFIPVQLTYDKLKEIRWF